jgi:hypothetical protein
MLEDAHKALEAMTSACTALKTEQWGEAERGLHQVQETVARLLREVADKSRDAMMVPKPDMGDRG